MSAKDVRIGFGYDVHRFAPGRKLRLGGVAIPHTMGLEGHSDADVLLHAICDAVLGAAALGDIGQHFPDTDKKYKGIASLKLLREVVKLIRRNNFAVVNVDSTVVLETPKIGPHVKKMRENVSRALGAKVDQISIKATTNENLGFVGRGEGCAAFAVVLLTQTN